MKKYIDTIVTIIITFAISLILNSGLNYLLRDHGAIKLGSVIEISGQKYLTLDIENYDGNPANGLLLALPSDTPIADVISSRPLDITELPSTIGNNQIKYANISGVEPHAVVELLIPLRDQSEQPLIRFTNLDEMGFETTNKGNAKSPFQTALQESLRIAIINALLYGIYAFWVNSESEKRYNSLKEETTKLKSDVKESAETTERLRKESDVQLKESKETIQRIRLYLLAQISDYQKELDFWKDTIRKLLYESKVDKITTEKLFDQITQSLKSYSVQERGIDFSAVEMLAKLLSNDKKT